ncbi:MAG: hypothetical protein KJZ86_27215 [Caldilineaceae bacterium]|nr:hypothetical protein [Caldilineaceae bacterium]HRJ40304.1 hypothetical protein [Caldilineaceae bacterium]
MTEADDFAVEMHYYQMRIAGRLDDEFVTSFCPAGTEATWDADGTRLERIETDQSGIIGLIRSLHNLGCTILYLERKEQ